MDKEEILARSRQQYRYKDIPDQEATRSGAVTAFMVTCFTAGLLCGLEMGEGFGFNYGYCCVAASACAAMCWTNWRLKKTGASLGLLLIMSALTIVLFVMQLVSLSKRSA